MSEAPKTRWADTATPPLTAASLGSASAVGDGVAVALGCVTGVRETHRAVPATTAAATVAAAR